MLLTLALGFAFGFVGSIPVAGPISLLVVAYSLQARYRDALALAAGGALAEGAYAALAFRGMSTLLARYPSALPWSRAAGAVVLTGLGIAFLRGHASSGERKPSASHRRSFLTGFGLTALNPTLLVTWTAATTTLYGTGLLSPDTATATPFAIGAGAGIVSWFSVLILLLRRHHGVFKPDTLGRAVRAVGVVLLGFGLWFGWLFVRDYVRPRPSSSTPTPATTSSIAPSVVRPSGSPSSSAPSSTAPGGLTYA